MALVKYGGGIIQMSGSLAGNTYARNRFANYVRARTKPVNPKTARQNTIRASLAFLCDRWAHTLDAAKRLAWNDYGKGVAMKNRLSESIFLTGFNHYIRSNMIRKQLGEAIIDDGPTINELPAQDDSMSVTATEDPQLLTIGYAVGLDWASEVGAMIVFFQGRPQNAQRNFFAGPWRLFGYRNGADPGPPVEPYFNTPVFAIAALQHLWVYARISRADGRLSEPFRANCFCGA